MRAIILKAIPPSHIRRMARWLGFSIGATWGPPKLFFFDVASSVYMHSHLVENCGLISDNIWTHEEFLRFATADETTITIWEVGFTSGDALVEVETFPTPDHRFQLFFFHGSWELQSDKTPMGHGLCNAVQRVVRSMTHGDKLMGDAELIAHGSWVVQWYIYPMGHGSYDTTPCPQPMGYATKCGICILHGSWIVQ